MHDAVADDGGGQGCFGGGGAESGGEGSSQRCERVAGGHRGGIFEGFHRDWARGGEHGREGEGRHAGGGAGVSAGWNAVEARGGWIGAGCTVFLFAEQVYGGGGFCDLRADTGALWIRDGGCSRWQFAVAIVVSAAAGEPKPVEDGGVLSQASDGSRP